MLAKALFIILVTFYNALDFGISDLLMDTILFPNNIGIQAGYSLYKFFSGKNDDEFQKDWEKEMNQLTRYEIDKLKKLFYYFSKNIEDFDEINYEKELNELSSIFEKEKKEIVNDYILDFISSNTIEKNIEDITRLNILCLGKSQIGKTTLINEILFLDEKHKGKVGGVGKSTTMNDTSYISDKLKHLKIIDSRGMESGNFSLKNFSEHYKNKMFENTKYGNYNDLIHCIWYCVSGNVMNGEEIAAIRQINSLFNNFKVPIIFVYLKPFYYKDIIVLKKRTSEINNNFIAVQSIHFIKECEKEDLNCFHDKVKYKPKNMDALLNMTKNLALDGIKNAVSSSACFYLMQNIEKEFEIRFEKKFEEFKNLLYYFEDIIYSKEFYISLDFINRVREKNIEKIIEIIEETLYNSKRKLSKEGIDIIYSIQNKIENTYRKKFSSLYNEHLYNFLLIIAEKKVEMFNEYQKTKWFGYLDNININDDLKEIEKFIDSNYIVQIYSMIASFETFNKKLKNHILSLLKSKIDKIIADKYSLEKLENKIKYEVEKKTMNMINSLDNEIRNSFNNRQT